MKAKQVIVICPFSRPEFHQKIIDNFNKQTFVNKKLIVIENKGAKFFGNATAVLQSDAHPAHAKNKGLEYIRDKYPGEFWTTFDDDDWYCSNYLQELVDNSDKGEVIGKLSTFMRGSNGKLRLLDYEIENDFVESVWGNSISSWVHTDEFPDVGLWGEDLEFLKNITDKGGRIFATSKYNICINRYHNNNTWKTTDQNMVNVCGGTVYEYDSFDIDIVSSEKDAPKRIVPKTKEFDFSHMIPMMRKENEFEDFINSFYERTT